MLCFICIKLKLNEEDDLKWPCSSDEYVVKGKLFFTKKGIAEFKIFSGQESFRISPFTKSNAWGFFSAEKANFKKGDLINCYFL